MSMCGVICTDNRFEIIADYKKNLIESTNIQESPEEMAVIDNILFRFWQMGWLPPVTPGGRLRGACKEDEIMSIKYTIEKGNCNPLPPYVWMANEATRNLPVYGTTIVAMRINGIRFNEILEYDAAGDCWSWLSDWYEGQTDIEFIGAIPLDEVRVNEIISE